MPSNSAGQDTAAADPINMDDMKNNDTILTRTLGCVSSAHMTAAQITLLLWAHRPLLDLWRGKLWICLCWFPCRNCLHMYVCKWVIDWMKHFWATGPGVIAARCGLRHFPQCGHKMDLSAHGVINEWLDNLLKENMLLCFCMCHIWTKALIHNLLKTNQIWSITSMLTRVHEQGTFPTLALTLKKGLPIMSPV